MALSVGAAVLAAMFVPAVLGQQAPVQFGGDYSGLGPRRQQLVATWVVRFNEATGQKAEAGPFYDEILSFSSKTTFDAVTHALMTTTLSDGSGAPLGDSLSLVERVESIRGEVAGASGDRQFRLYVRLVEGALDTLERSKEFRRGADNAVYHKGFPRNYRQQGGVPSIQISVATDGRRADVDVDYRSSMFPVSMFNGHLSSANSDVRAGNNSDRHSGRWAGLENWWRGFFGIRLNSPAEPEPKDKTFALPKAPRAGRKNIDVMANDFLKAWLVEGDVNAAMGYVSEQAYACLAQDSEDPSDFDRGLAPFQLLMNLKAAHDTLGPRRSLEDATVGVRFPVPGLKVVTQPYHAQFVIYSVPDDAAADFDCESRLTLGRNDERRAYGNYFGVTFNVAGQKSQAVALLWAREDGYWKIVSWRTGADDPDAPALVAPPDATVARIPADPGFARAARAFLETWLIRRNYDAAFGYLSPQAYACYNLLRDPDEPAATSPDEAGRRIRAGFERAGKQVGSVRSLDRVLSPAEPVLPVVRVMDHADSRVFSLTSLPNAIAAASDCGARTRGEPAPAAVPAEYGRAFGLNIRFQTRGGEAPVLRTMWAQENGAWRVTAYDLELP
jgi:hypothetical protein